MNDQDPRQILANRLRALREEHWPGKKVTQEQLAKALGGEGRRSVSVPLISSWESRGNPKVPPADRIRDIATFFASPRSFDGQAGRLLSVNEMKPPERVAREQLLDELSRLRREALDAPGVLLPRIADPGTTENIARSLNAGLYRFNEGEIVTIVCAELPAEMRQRMPYTELSDPDYIELYRYAELDSLFELHGHLRATNPASRVHRRLAHELVPDDYTGHLVLLGGVDWNEATTSVLGRLKLPVRQVNDWKEPGGAYFEVTQDDKKKIAHRPWLDKTDGQEILREDVALFARAVSPFNRKRFVTICNGMYGRGTYGAVRALTDERFRDRNMEHIRARFAGSDTFCLLTRVTVENGVTLTPDWTLPETVLFEWSRPQ